MARMSKKRRLEIEVALDAVKMHQTEFWEAMSALEDLIDGLELDGNTDYEGFTVEHLLDMAKMK